MWLMLCQTVIMRALESTYLVDTDSGPNPPQVMAVGSHHGIRNSRSKELWEFAFSASLANSSE